ncbi:uncharacterized protein [Choristoneura fumiferana]|uniref:uncharacterized protein n=1 Tax=Choristoneura fumiferana TaxID=7141 RepID=UPI003D154F1C
METSSANGCIYSNKSETSKTPQECNGKESSINGTISNRKNGYTKSATSLNGVGDGPSARAPPIPPLDWAALDASGDVFEKCSLLTAALTQLGFYVLLLLGYLNQLLFPPNVATEKNREVRA